MNNNELVTLLQEKLKYLQSRLQAHARRLSESMADLANRLDTDNPCLNSCGEIQGEGTRIDTLCAEIGVLAGILQQLKQPDKESMPI